MEYCGIDLHAEYSQMGVTLRINALLPFNGANHDRSPANPVKLLGCYQWHPKTIRIVVIMGGTLDIYPR